MNSILKYFVLLAAAVGRGRRSAKLSSDASLSSEDTPEEALEDFTMKMEISSYESGLLNT